jgi:hypothetical protein
MTSLKWRLLQVSYEFQAKCLTLLIITEKYTLLRVKISPKYHLIYRYFTLHRSRRTKNSFEFVARPRKTAKSRERSDWSSEKI